MHDSITSLRFAPSPQQEQRFPEPAPGHRDWYVHEALRMMPRLILMIDKNRFSETYGCFDREFWHYRTVDFPCAMNQEFCLPLALAYAHPFPNNPYYKLERLKELVIASIEFARKTSHDDGSCDDYFPFERALGALVFSTYAMTESYITLGLERDDFIRFFKLRGDWLATHNETGQLANHQAFAALALYNVYLITGEEKYLDASNHFRDITLSWQHEEGWFQEYEGADPGYHSCSIAFLGKLYQKSKDPLLEEPLKRAVDFATYFMHPDGSYAGEYGSRNTFHFYPHGFEVVSEFYPQAARVAETFLQRAMPERRRYFNDDNRMCAHYVYDWMQSWLDYNGDARDGTLDDHRGNFTRYFDDAQILVKKTDHYYAVCSLAKGAVIKAFDNSGPIYSDTGLIAKTTDGEVLVPHLVDDQHVSSFDEESGTITVRGQMSKRRYPLPSPVKQMAFRGMNLSVGRFGANAVRSILQTILITGKPRTEVTFERTIKLEEGDIIVNDVIDTSATDVTVAEIARSSDATSIYVANSNTFQESVLTPWHDLTRHAGELNKKRRLEFPEHRVFGSE